MPNIRFSRLGARPNSGAPLIALLALVLLSWTPGAAEAGTNSPVVPVPQERWGALEPRSIPGDSTAFLFNTEPRCDRSQYNPFWLDIDSEAGFIFATTGKAVEAYRIGGDPGNPELQHFLCEPVIGTFKASDTDFYWFDVDAPPGNPSIVAVGMGSKMGILVLRHDTSGSTSTLSELYQDEGASTYGEDYSTVDVVALKAGGRQLLFVRTSKNEVLAYDLDRIQQLDAPCLQGTGCGGGAYLGKLPGKATSIAGAGKYLMYLASGKIDVYDVSASPTQPASLGSISLANTLIGIAAAQRSGSVYVAGVGFGKAEVYDVACLPSSCGNSRKVLQVPGGDFVKGSTDPATGKAYFYVGSNQSRVGGSQLEYLIDTDTWEDLTPQEHPDGYWGWYYEGNDTGFRNMQARAAIVVSNHMYRAAHSFFDIHEIVDGSGPPVAAFDWTPQEPYAEDPVDFTDASTGSPTSLEWTFTDATDSVLVTVPPEPDPTTEFLSPGLKDVTLVASNEFGSSDPLTRSVTVLDPDPVVHSLTPNVTAAPVCSTVDFTADVSGKPPLTFDWDVLDSGDVSTGAGETSTSATFSWTVPQSQAPGSYRASLTVTGVSESPTVLSPAVEIQALEELAFLDAGDPVADPLDYLPSASDPDLGQVDFGVSARGATRWIWDFGDGDSNACPAGFTKVGTACSTTDPAVGVAPSHQYTTGDTTYLVTVTVENCRDGQITSGVREVAVGSVAELKPKFEAQDICLEAFGCFATVGVPVTFEDLTTGFPDSYEVDWKGNGNFVSETPVDGNFTHTYTSASTTAGYKPVLRAIRGSLTETFTHVNSIVVESGGPAPTPSVSVSRSTFSPLVGATVTFTASANNCSAPSSWSWTIGSGGSISGSTSGSSINVTYSSPGSRTITATALGGGCDGLSGSTTVSVQDESDPGPGPGPGPGPSLTASFSFDPASPKVGTEVEFDASASSSDATGYLWTFGDGGEGIGKQVSHAYQTAGSYKVKLEVSKPDDSCPFGICVASKELTVVVGEGSQPGPTEPKPGNGCSGELAEDDGVLCLSKGRFAVRATFDHPENGTSEAKAIWHADRTGFFWFFRPTNVELVVKVLNGTPVNGNFWVFYGSLSNRDYSVEVTDLDTGESRVFGPAVTEGGQQGGAIRCGQQIVDAFPGDGSAQGGSSFVTAADTRGGLTANFSYTVDGNTVGFDASDSLGSPDDHYWNFGDGSTAFGEQVSHTYTAPGTYTVSLEVTKDDSACDFLCAHTVSAQVVVGESGGGEAGGEEPSGDDGGDGGGDDGTDEPSTTLSLLSDRFEVSVDYRFLDLTTDEVKAEGQGKAIVGTDQSGYFWFNRSDNLELVVKMVDATSFTGEFWVFWAGLTNFEYTLTVTDTVSGESWTQVKPQKEFCGGVVTDFFKVAP